MKKKYKLASHSEPEMAVTHFKWQIDIENNALMSWKWPANPDVKYMLAAATTQHPDDPLAWLMEDPNSHAVVTRTLTAHYEVPIGDAPKRYIFAPAYLKGKEIAVYGPALVTDLLYAKVHAEVRITNSNIPFSSFKRVDFSLHFSGENAGSVLGKNALRYAVYEMQRLVGVYALDDEILTGGYIYIRKTQHIRFIIQEAFAQFIALV
ncbi:MAG: hypothetical protein FWB88_05445 [Defluviitaleaceae bacterium]|nr:hypothetical protein [Defluviitaleaceae bacterium]MCL2240667.1 hypothetical protein [Defluviitaleaceae bacterium]